jgi:hypothetical protein
MNKQDRLQYLIRKGEALKQQEDDKNTLAFAALPVTGTEVADDVHQLDAFIEAQKDKNSSKESLTSDEQ